MYFEYHHKDHQEQVTQINGQQVFPFQCQQLVDTQAGECPFKPHDDKYHNGTFSQKPKDRRDVVHHGVEIFPTRYM